MMELCVNQVYRNVATNERFRTVWLSPDRSEMYVYLLGADKGFPTKEAQQSITDGIEQGWIELVDDETLHELKDESRMALLAVAAYFGDVLLIDNIELTRKA